MGERGRRIHEGRLIEKERTRRTEREITKAGSGEQL